MSNRFSHLLAFANFYCHFIVKLLGNHYSFNPSNSKRYQVSWGPEHQNTFDELKFAFTQAPVLAHFNPVNPTVVEMDTSDYAMQLSSLKFPPKMVTCIQLPSSPEA